MAGPDLEQIMSQIAALMNSDNLDDGAEAARQLRTLSMDYRLQNSPQSRMPRIADRLTTCCGTSRANEEVRSSLGHNPLLLGGLLHLLVHGSDAARYWGCQCIVSLSHKHTENQRVIARYPGMIVAILHVLLQGGALSRGAACSALVESTFRNAGNALLVAKTPGMMLGVVSVMQTSAGDVRDDAAGVLRNCSNYSREAAEIIVRTPGVLDALIEMCKGRHNSDRFTAMGTIQNLTRCESVAPLLCKTRVIAEALEPALSAVGTGEEHDVMRAEALMAITNLTTTNQLPHLVAVPDIVEIIVQMLRCAIGGHAWKDVAWYDAEECLRPLERMTVNTENHGVLRSAGLVHVLADLMCCWVEEQSLRLPAFVHDEAQRSLARGEALADFDTFYEWSDYAMSRGNGMTDGDLVVVENADALIGIGHARLRHALAVWHVAATRPALLSTKRSSAVCLDQAQAPSRPDRGHCFCFLEEGRGQGGELSVEVEIAALALVKLAATEACARTMCRLGLPAVLRAAATAAAVPCTNLSVQQANPWAQLWVMEPWHLALWMGQHPRLGSRSLLLQLDAPLLWLIIQGASCMSSALEALADAVGTQSSRDAGQLGTLRGTLTGTCSPLTVPARTPAASPPLHLADGLEEAGADCVYLEEPDTAGKEGLCSADSGRMCGRLEC